MENITVSNQSIRRQQSLKKIARWGKITGIFFMISGGLSALVGLLSFIIGAIPGLLLAYTGYLIFNSAKSADALSYGWSENELDKLLNDIGQYYMISGVLIIIGLVLSILGFGLMMTLIDHFMSLQF